MPSEHHELEETYSESMLGSPRNHNPGEQKVLGIRWSVESNKLMIRNSQGPRSHKERNCQSGGKVLQPSRFLAPIVMQFKMFVRSLCEATLGWLTEALCCGSGRLSALSYKKANTSQSHDATWVKSYPAVCSDSVMLHVQGRYLAYQVFIVQLVHVHAMVLRPFSMYERTSGQGYIYKVHNTNETQN